jgi:S-methylmethionine-dependent homocysteine/selenocysteine methylase
MIDQPELVREVHADFVAAGADVITINAYSATRCRLGPVGLEHQYERLQTLACELATDARGDRDDVLIAGCLSPYGWSYRPDLAPPFDELWALYAETAELQVPHVDLFVCETMGSIEEARAAVSAAAPTGKPVWVSWTVHDDDTARLRSGEALLDAIAAIDDLGVDATLVNCSVPEALTAAMPALATSPTRFGAYGNGFSRIVDSFVPGSVATELGHRHDLTPTAYADIALGWVHAGATIVGGCCEIGPEHIAELGRRLAELS